MKIESYTTPQGDGFAAVVWEAGSRPEVIAVVACQQTAQTLADVERAGRLRDHLARPRRRPLGALLLVAAAVLCVALLLAACVVPAGGGVSAGCANATCTPARTPTPPSWPAGGN